MDMLAGGIDPISGKLDEKNSALHQERLQNVSQLIEETVVDKNR